MLITQGGLGRLICFLFSPLVEINMMNHSGFTVLELVLVILIAGILSVMALPRLYSAGELEQQFTRPQ